MRDGAYKALVMYVMYTMNYKTHSTHIRLQPCPIWWRSDLTSHPKLCTESTSYDHLRQCHFPPIPEIPIVPTDAPKCLDYLRTHLYCWKALRWQHSRARSVKILTASEDKQDGFVQRPAEKWVLCFQWVGPLRRLSGHDHSWRSPYQERLGPRTGSWRYYWRVFQECLWNNGASLAYCRWFHDFDWAHWKDNPF